MFLGAEDSLMSSERINFNWGVSKHLKRLETNVIFKDDSETAIVI